jgi:phosphate transport system substrate-binding protein
MRIHKTVRLAVTATAAAVTALSMIAVPALAGTRSPKTSDPYLIADTQMNFQATIGGAGSTFAAPLENAAQAAFTARNTNATINGYQAVGSGTGESDILKKIVDWGGSDVPMAQSDISSKEPAGDNYTVSQFLQVPIGLGGVAIAYRVPGLKLKPKTSLVLTAGVLANIYLGNIKYWNSAAIKKLNPGDTFPHARIVVVARADSSGTTYITTNFLNDAAPAVWTTPPSKTPLTLPADGIAGSGNAGVAADIENTPYSIGYVEYSYLLLNPSLLKGVAAIVNESGKALLPTPAGIAAAAAAKPDITSTDFSIDWLPGKTTYPICGYTWAVIWKQNQTTDAEGTLLVKYLDWLSHSGAADGTTAGQDIAVQQGYVALPANIQALARKTLLQVTGSSGQPLLTTSSGS